VGDKKKKTPILSTQTDSIIYKKLFKKALILGVKEKDIPYLIYHIDKLSNIIINSYINSKEQKPWKT